MNATTTVTIRVSPDVNDKLNRLARGTRRSRSLLAAEALSAYVDRELAIIADIEEGLADVAAGRLMPHEQVMAEAQRIIEDAKKARG